MKTNLMLAKNQFLAIVMAACATMLSACNDDNDDLIAGKICTGSTQGTYYTYAGGVIAAAKATLGLELENISTAGSVENARNIVNGTCDMGIVQADLYINGAGSPLQGDKDFSLLTASDGTVAALYQETVHILANTSSGINSISDLAGKKVNIGSQGSGTFVTATKLLTAMNTLSTSPVFSHDNAFDAINKVVDGTYDAAVIVAAIPITALADLPTTAPIKLIPATLSTTTTEYVQSQIPNATYPWQNTEVANNAAVWSLLAIGESIDKSKLPAFMDELFNNKNSYAIDYHSKWSELSKTENIAAIKSIPTSGWQTEAIHYYAGRAAPSMAPQNFLCSASTTGTYTKVAQDLIPVIQDAIGLSLTEVNTAGSIENMGKLYSGECAIAIVQFDAAGYAITIDRINASNITTLGLAAHSNSLIMPLYVERPHLIVNENSGITSNRDLRGKKFNLGPEGSGSYASAVTTLLLSGLTLNDVVASNEAPTEALAKVISGEYDAMFITQKEPVDFLAAVDANAPIEVVNIDIPNLTQTTPFTASTYPWQDKDIPNLISLNATLYVSPALNLSEKDTQKLMEAIYAIPNDGSTFSSTWGETTKANSIAHLNAVPYQYDLYPARYLLSE